MNSIDSQHEKMAHGQQSLPLIEVVAGIIWRDNLFLAAKRVPPSPLAGFWEFPGGKCHANETFEEALKRELDEELGIQACELSAWLTHDYAYTKEGYRVRLHFFHVTKHTGEALPREGQILRWVTPSDALKLPFLPADKPIISAIAALKNLP